MPVAPLALAGLAGCDFTRLPYPVALTAQRLDAALQSSGDVLKTLFLVKDCFEATIKYIGAVLLAEYRRSPAFTAQHTEVLLKSMMRPSLGAWVNEVVQPLTMWLIVEHAPPGSLAAALFAEPPEKPGGKPAESSVFRQCKAFVTYRNDALGHGAQQRDSVYEENLAKYLPLVRRLLDGVAGLPGWRLCLVTAEDRCQVWLGPKPDTATEPGNFSATAIGHFVLRGPGAEYRDLFPVVCYLPDRQQEKRLHYYDSLLRYQATRKEANVLEYDNGERHPRPEPAAGLEAAFTAGLLAKAFKEQRSRMAVIEGRVANFDEILQTHAAIVGRRFVIEHVRRFLAQHDRGLLLIEGEPGKGKTALLAHLIEEVFDQNTPLPVHFFYRRTAGITDPNVCAKSLYYALLEAHGITEAEELKQKAAPEEVLIKLTNLLSQEIAPRLLPGRPQLIFLDALDEAAGPGFQRIPESLPAGVYIIATTRPVSDRAALVRRQDLHWYDLDSPVLLQENLRDGFAYFQRELLGIELPIETLTEIARVGAGNFLVLKLLCEHLRTTLPPDQVADFLRRVATDGGKDQLGFIFAEFWNRMTDRCTREDANWLCDVAGVLVTAHAPLTADMVCGVLSMRAGDWDFALRRLAEYLVAIDYDEKGVEETFYRIYYESFADFLRAKVATDRRRYGDRLADYCLGWERLPESYGRNYALRFGPRHLLEAGRIDEAAALLLDLFFLEAKTTAGLVFDLLEDFRAVASLLSADRPQRRALSLLEEALRRDIHFIARHKEDYPQALFQCLWNVCWWYDCPDAAAHYEEDQAPGQDAGVALHKLLEKWRTEKEQAFPGFVWVRSLRPPAPHLGTAQKAVFHGHEGVVESVAFSPDGRQIVSGSDDCSLRLWDAATGGELRCLPGHEDKVKSVAFSPDGRLIVSGSEDHKVRLWDAATGDELRCLEGHDGWVTSVACSPDGRLVASGSSDKTVRLWDAATGDELLLLEGHNYQVNSVAFSADGQCLAFASGVWNVQEIRWELKVWDATTGEESLLVEGEEDSLTSVAFSPDGRQIVTGSGDNTVRLWDASTGAQLRSLQGHKKWVTCVAFSPDGRQIVSGSYDHTVRLWDAATGDQLPFFFRHEEAVENVAFSPDGQHVVSASWDQTVRLWDLVTGAKVCRVRGHEDNVAGVGFSPDGRQIVTGSVDGTVRLWDAAAGTLLLCLEGHQAPVWSVAFSRDGRQIVSGSHDQTVRLWDAATGTQLRCIEGPEGHFVEKVAFSPNGRQVASASTDNTARVWDAATGAQQHCLQGHEQMVRSVAFSPDGQQIASGSDDTTVRLWDAVSGTQLRCLQGHEGGVLSLAFSPDGRRIVSGSWDQTVRLWDLATGTCLQRLDGRGDVAAIAAGAARLPWRTLSGVLETVIESIATGQTVAWFTVKLAEINTHPSARTWAGGWGNYFCLFTLEGDA